MTAKKRSKRAHFSSDLPYDVMLDIIKRLPFESIMALKCVSKQWEDAINISNRFIFDKIVTFPSGDTFNCLFLTTDDDDEEETARPYPAFTVLCVPPPGPTKQHRKTKGVYDGMACYYKFGGCSSSQFVFYNLLTGASHTIRNAPLQKHEGFGGDEEEDSTWPWNCYGFGYDPYDDDYKMMVVCNYNIDGTQTTDMSKFWVYCFKKRSWLRYSGFPHDHYDWSNNLRMACAFGGKLYWFVAAYVDDDKEEEQMMMLVILTYDLHTFGFCEINAPDVYEEGYEISMANLMELGGRLCYWSCDDKKIDVWVMNEEDSSWTRLLRMEMKMQYRIEPVMMYRFGDGRELMLFVCPRNGKLYWYNVKNNEVVKAVNKSTWLKTRVVGLRQPKPKLRIFM